MLKLSFKLDVQVQVEHEVEFYFEMNIDLDTIFDNKLLKLQQLQVEVWLQYHVEVEVKIYSKICNSTSNSHSRWTRIKKPQKFDMSKKT